MSANGTSNHLTKFHLILFRSCKVQISRKLASELWTVGLPPTEKPFHLYRYKTFSYTTDQKDYICVEEKKNPNWFPNTKTNTQYRVNMPSPLLLPGAQSRTKGRNLLWFHGSTGGIVGHFGERVHAPTGHSPSRRSPPTESCCESAQTSSTGHRANTWRRCRYYSPSNKIFSEYERVKLVIDDLYSFCQTMLTDTTCMI